MKKMLFTGAWSGEPESEKEREGGKERNDER